MPWSRIEDLPNNIKSNLPKHAAEIWLAAFNASFEKHGETPALKIAWSAVKRQYYKGKDGKWHPHAKTDKAHTPVYRVTKTDMPLIKSALLRVGIVSTQRKFPQSIRVLFTGGRDKHPKVIQALNDAGFRGATGDMFTKTSFNQDHEIFVHSKIQSADTAADAKSVLNHTNLKKAISVYSHHLLALHKAGKTSYGEDKLPEVVAKMIAALANGNGDVNGSAVKATAKQLGFKSTRMGWMRYLRTDVVHAKPKIGGNIAGMLRKAQQDFKKLNEAYTEFYRRFPHIDKVNSDKGLSDGDKKLYETKLQLGQAMMQMDDYIRSLKALAHKDTASAKPTSKLMYESVSKHDGLRSEVHERADGKYAVTTVCLDSGERLPTATIFSDLNDAKKYARKCSGIDTAAFVSPEFKRFKAKNTALAEWIEQNKSANGFAKSLYDYIVVNGGLTAAQKSALQRQMELPNESEPVQKVNNEVSVIPPVNTPVNKTPPDYDAYDTPLYHVTAEHDKEPTLPPAALQSNSRYENFGKNQPTVAKWLFANYTKSPYLQGIIANIGRYYSGSTVSTDQMRVLHDMMRKDGVEPPKQTAKITYRGKTYLEDRFEKYDDISRRYKGRDVPFPQEPAPAGVSAATPEITKTAESTLSHFDKFKAAHPAHADWLEANKQSNNFASSLHRQISGGSTLTQRQMEALNRITEQKDKDKGKDTEEKPPIHTDTLMKAFDEAKKHKIDHPKMRFNDFIASPAPATGRNPGAIYIKSHENVYLGAIKDGKFFPTKDCTREIENAVHEAMKNPLKEAVAYGKKHGHCCMCGRRLDNAESIRLGIGPICKDNYGL